MKLSICAALVLALSASGVALGQAQHAVAMVL
jgi:hypothetical protein